MAHFAELDSNNKVLRVVVACNQDVANHGGDQSEQAAEYFKTVCPLSVNGVKWIQTSYNNNFRGKFAGIGDTYDVSKNKFIAEQPYPSWILNNNDHWEAPIPCPDITIDNIIRIWNESNQSWDPQ